MEINQMIDCVIYQLNTLLLEARSSLYLDQMKVEDE